MAWRVQQKRWPWQDQAGALHIAPANDIALIEGARSESTEKELRKQNATLMSWVENYCVDSCTQHITYSITNPHKSFWHAPVWDMVGYHHFSRIHALKSYMPLFLLHNCILVSGYFTLVFHASWKLSFLKTWTIYIVSFNMQSTQLPILFLWIHP